ncbi:MAG: hypothetical protein IJB89_00010 [Akkermansia sp.]|nr:hypothetical protein [Akkermansia sp.]
MRAATILGGGSLFLGKIAEKIRIVSEAGFGELLRMLGFNPEHDQLTKFLLLRQLKIDVLSVLVVTDKLEVVGRFARRRRAEFQSP